MCLAQITAKSYKSLTIRREPSDMIVKAQTKSRASAIIPDINGPVVAPRLCPE